MVIRVQRRYVVNFTFVETPERQFFGIFIDTSVNRSSECSVAFIIRLPPDFKQRFFGFLPLSEHTRGERRLCQTATEPTL